MGEGIALTVSYDGSGFHGFARQEGLSTVQGTLESALATVLRTEIRTTGAGRTDTGVHARAQVVSFEADDVLPDLDSLVRSLNALCASKGIAIKGARRTAPDFSARFDASSREYRYRLATGATPPVFMSRYAWWVRKPLDLEAMQEGGVILIGEHDFASFCVARSAEGKSTVRALEVVDVDRHTLLGEECVTVRVIGDAFLHSMVRVVVGSLVEVGIGKREPSWLADALSAKIRRAAGPTAPSHGLTLWNVTYPESCWVDQV
ncbi:MAG: tRNA pseudouridine(38-40) synthase TruA [Actinobacteria bacterium]|nr:tRNA pseudouridine(38-40) synthase TruA [Actinomycetota bacterium]MCL5887155.1 tRNA pseudouridine(38-40) synthase TruA [Actinomycetota bacterium]